MSSDILTCGACGGPARQWACGECSNCDACNPQYADQTYCVGVDCPCAPAGALPTSLLTPASPLTPSEAGERVQAALMKFGEAWFLQGLEQPSTEAQLAREQRIIDSREEMRHTLRMQGLQCDMLIEALRLAIKYARQSAFPTEDRLADWERLVEGDLS